MIRATALALTLLFGSSDDPDAMQKLHEWVLAVDQHRAGKRDPALDSIGAWTYDDLAALRGYIEALAGLPNNSRDRAIRRRQISRRDFDRIVQRTQELQARGDFPLFLKRAAILHTDVALLTEVPELMPASTAGEQSRRAFTNSQTVFDVMGRDGQTDGYQRANPHWNFAMDMLEALPAKPDRDPIVGQWYGTIAAFFARRDNTADGSRLFERARKIVEGHPDVAYAEACLHEKLGAPRMQDFAKITQLSNGRKLIGIDSAQNHVRRAEALLRQALAARPDFPAASLRLGHILLEKKDYDAAIAVLQQVLPKLGGPAAYYANLFSGDASLALGRGADARASFERALELYPDSQSARLALGAALRYMGDRQAALDAMQLTLNTPPNVRDSREEPWWDYYEGDTDHVDRLVELLRDPYRSARQ